MMKSIAVVVDNISKYYDLGVIGTGTISRDINRWWARVRGNPDPYAIIGEADNGDSSRESIWALRDVSFKVEKGEALGIIGQNGAGKSTLLKILSQITAPTSGEVRIKGRIGSLLEVGTGFHPELTGRENVFLNGAILGMSRTEVKRKFDEIVDFSGIEKFIDTPVKRYSSGMYVRLAFAVAAHLEPEILIVDEVLAVGDAAFQKKCLGKMGEVAGGGRTVLFVSHNMIAVQTLCKKCILLENGKLVQAGDASKITQLYLEDNENLGIIKTQSNNLIWKGVGRKEFNIDDNVLVNLFFGTMDQAFRGVQVDIAVANPAGQKIIRLQSNLVSQGFEWQKGKEYCVSFEINKPYLAPGKYHLEIYLRDENKVIFWAQNIEGFEILTKTLEEHEKLFYDRVGYIMPRFEVQCLDLG